MLIELSLALSLAIPTDVYECFGLPLLSESLYTYYYHLTETTRRLEPLHNLVQ